MVNRISFEGNERTHDVVLKEKCGKWKKVGFPQFAWNFKIKVDRLGFLKAWNTKNSVPGSSDEVDVVFKVDEQFSGSIGGSIGYGAYGFNLGANYSENAFGTGNSVSVGVNYSEWRQDISFNFFDPYFNWWNWTRIWSIL